MFWREVVSPSPPVSVSGKPLSRYGHAWAELMKEVRNGASWSGLERNCCFVNIAGGRFLDISSLSGIDFDDDGRAMAICDWDRDGDQDIWFRNRSAPRIRLMENKSSGAQSVYIRLEGVECNRDGIGSVVEIDGSDKPLLRSVRAGEMFLSQSSKWLHFGVGSINKDLDFIVYWPGGQAERFQGARTGGRYVLRQGTGISRVAVDPESKQVPVVRKKKDAIAQQYSGILLPVPVPLPALSFRDPSAQIRSFKANGQTTLLTLWNSESEASVRLLNELERGRVQMAAAGVRVLALSSNGINNAGGAYDMIEKCEFSWEWGFIVEESKEAIFRWQAALFERSPKRDFPLSLLLNSEEECVAVYRVGMSVDEILRDARNCIGIDRMTRWHLAPPIGGTWFTNPVGEQFVRKVVREAVVKKDR